MAGLDKKKLIKDMIQYTVIAFMLYFSGDTAWGATNAEMKNCAVIFMAIISACYYLIVKKSVSVKFAKIYMICMMCIVCSMIINADFSGFSWLMVMFTGMLISEMIPFDSFILKYADILLIISIASVIGVAVWQMQPSLLEVLPVLSGGGTDALANAVVTVVPKDYFYIAIRCYGIFREPSMYAIYLIIALTVELFYREKNNYIRIGIFVISLALTRSMTGFAALAVMVLAYFFYHKVRGMEWIIWTFILAMGVVYLICGSVQGFGTVWDYIYARLQRTGSSAHSINSRIASITVNIYTWLTHPFAGAGAVKSQELFNLNLSKLGYPQGLTGTNMITYGLASFGIIFTGIFISGLYGFSQNICHRKNVFFILAVICICFCGQTMHYSVFPFLLMFYGYDRNIILEGRRMTVEE